jgi:hypothetical protein
LVGKTNIFNRFDKSEKNPEDWTINTIEYDSELEYESINDDWEKYSFWICPPTISFP